MQYTVCFVLLIQFMAIQTRAVCYNSHAGLPVIMPTQYLQGKIWHLKVPYADSRIIPCSSLPQVIELSENLDRKT